MNENEKMEFSEEQTSPLSSQIEETTLEEQESDKTACVETESPAESLSEVADARKDDSGELTSAEIHAMSKEQLVEKLKSLIEENKLQANREVNLMKQCFFTITKSETEAQLQAFVEAGNQIEAFESVPEPLETEFNELLTAFKNKRAAWLEAEESRRQANLALKVKAIDGIKALMEDVDNINRNYAEFQKLQQDFKEVKDIPQQSETDIWNQYQKVVEQFYDLLKLNKELRDLDFRKNLETKREMIEKAKQLAELADPVEASRQLQALHRQWREIGPVAKDIREEIWEEFREASSVVNRRHQEYFEQRKADEQKNEEAKIKLCEEVETIDFATLNNYADWDKTTEQIKEIQARWREIGFTSRKTNTSLYNRFRTTIDRFFEKKTEFYKSLREDFKRNLEKKNALCEEVEKLAEVEITSKTINRVKELQEEWKTIGSVDRKQSDLIWRRFINGCNAIYNIRRKAAGEKKSEENANYIAKKEIVEALNSIFNEPEETSDSISRFRSLQDKWRSIGFVPFNKKEALQEEYHEIVTKLVDKLGIGKRDRRFSDRGSRGRDVTTGSNPRASLMERIRSRKSELQTYENNLGFFNVKSSAGNSMVREFQQKIERIKNDISRLEQELKELDSQAEE